LEDKERLQEARRSVETTAVYREGRLLISSDNRRGPRKLSISCKKIQKKIILSINQYDIHFLVISIELCFV
jgi:hypothetical protein